MYAYAYVRASLHACSAARGRSGSSGSGTRVCVNMCGSMSSLIRTHSNRARLAGTHAVTWTPNKRRMHALNIMVCFCEREDSSVYFVVDEAKLACTIQLRSQNCPLTSNSNCLLDSNVGARKTF